METEIEKEKTAALVEARDMVGYNRSWSKIVIHCTMILAFAIQNAARLLAKGLRG